MIERYGFKQKTWVSPLINTNWDHKDERYLHLGDAPFGSDLGIGRTQLLLLCFWKRVEMICVREKSFLSFNVRKALIPGGDTRACDFLEH